MLFRGIVRPVHGEKCSAMGVVSPVLLSFAYVMAVEAQSRNVMSLASGADFGAASKILWSELGNHDAELWGVVAAAVAVVHLKVSKRRPAVVVAAVPK